MIPALIKDVAVWDGVESKSVSKSLPEWCRDLDQLINQWNSESPSPDSFVPATQCRLKAKKHRKAVSIANTQMSVAWHNICKSCSLFQGCRSPCCLRFTVAILKSWTCLALRDRPFYKMMGTQPSQDYVKKMMWWKTCQQFHSRKWNANARLKILVETLKHSATKLCSSWSGAVSSGRFSSRFLMNTYLKIWL